MSTIPRGSWRKTAGEYKVFVKGCEQQTETIVEAVSQAGKSAYTVITSTHSKISGGYLYNFYYTHKPEETTPKFTATTTININTPQTSTVGAEVGIDELNAALGLD